MTKKEAMSEIHKLCTAIKTQPNLETGRRYRDKDIAKHIFVGNPIAREKLSQAKSEGVSYENTNTFGGKNRTEIIEAIQKEFAVQLKAAGYIAQEAQYFSFKQYFMTDKDEGIVAVATLLLFYTKVGKEIIYERYKIIIPATENYPDFVLRGAVQRYENGLILQQQTQKSYGTTLLCFDSTFFRLPPTAHPNTLYHGNYVTVSEVGEMLSGKLLVQCVQNHEAINYTDVPSAVHNYLSGTFTKIPPPIDLSLL